MVGGIRIRNRGPGKPVISPSDESAKKINLEDHKAKKPVSPTALDLPGDDQTGPISSEIKLHSAIDPSQVPSSSTRNLMNSDVKAVPDIVPPLRLLPPRPPPINNMPPPPPLPLQLTVDVGPWGGDGGSSWDDGIYDGIREIKIHAGLCIDSISVVYDKNGEPFSAERHGGGGGSPFEFKLQYPEEYLIHISGHYEPFFNGLSMPIIRSLKFKTNKGTTFGPFGPKSGKFFTLPIARGRIVGFFGRSGIALDCIGFHLTC